MNQNKIISTSPVQKSETVRSGRSWSLIPISNPSGKVTIEHAGKVLWSQEILTGENEMCHYLRNIEHHHFKFETHRRPGDLHVHFFGACALSFGAGVQLADDDVMEICFAGFGRSLRNPLRIARDEAKLVTVKSLA